MYIQIYIYIYGLYHQPAFLYVDFSFLQLSVLFLDSARWSYIFKQTLKHQAILANKRKVEKFPHRSRFYLLSQKYLTVPQTNTNPHSKRNSLGKSMFYKSERLYFIYIYIQNPLPNHPLKLGMELALKTTVIVHRQQQVAQMMM